MHQQHYAFDGYFAALAAPFPLAHAVQWIFLTNRNGRQCALFGYSYCWVDECGRKQNAHTNKRPVVVRSLFRTSNRIMDRMVNAPSHRCGRSSWVNYATSIVYRTGSHKNLARSRVRAPSSIIAIRVFKHSPETTGWHRRMTANGGHHHKLSSTALTKNVSGSCQILHHSHITYIFPFLSSSSSS
jgi:hypothetical protein